MKSKYIKINFRLYESIYLDLTKHIVTNNINKTHRNTYNFYRLSNQERYVFYKRGKDMHYNLRNLKNPFLLSLFLVA